MSKSSHDVWEKPRTYSSATYDEEYRMDVSRTEGEDAREETRGKICPREEDGGGVGGGGVGGVRKLGLAQLSTSHGRNLLTEFLVLGIRK